jgi:L-serine dehydratase
MVAAISQRVNPSAAALASQVARISRPTPRRVKAGSVYMARDAGGLGRRVQHGGVATGGVVAPEQGGPAAPAATAGDRAVGLDHIIGAVGDELAVQPHDLAGGGDLFGRQEGRKELADRPLHHAAQGGNVGLYSQAEGKRRTHAPNLAWRRILRHFKPSPLHIIAAPWRGVAQSPTYPGMASVFDLFKLGVGPSSSHTMGPMTAGARFLERLAGAGLLAQVERVEISLYASLALTGRGHATDRAVILGLLGFRPATIDPDAGDAALEATKASGRLTLGNGGPTIGFDEARDILWEGRKRLPQHPNALAFRAYAGEDLLLEDLYFSVGGGFVVDAAEMEAAAPAMQAAPLPYPFASGAELLERADGAGLSIAELMFANETATRTAEEVHDGLDAIFAAMEACIERGLRQGRLPAGRAEGSPPGPPDPQRTDGQGRAQYLRPPGRPRLGQSLGPGGERGERGRRAGGHRADQRGGRAAAGGAALLRPLPPGRRGGAADRFLLTAAAIGALYKRNASISGAEVGCQGEVGVACSMAAAGLTAALGGTNAQVENAAEIAMEHNLGLTCDPIGGLVQIPCIERNAMGAVKAIDASRLAMLGDGQHTVSLDKVIATMKRTGEDMSEIYKETSLGGLAVNVVEC